MLLTARRERVARDMLRVHDEPLGLSIIPAEVQRSSFQPLQQISVWCLEVATSFLPIFPLNNSDN